MKLYGCFQRASILGGLSNREKFFPIEQVQRKFGLVINFVIAAYFENNVSLWYMYTSIRAIYLNSPTQSFLH